MQTYVRPELVFTRGEGARMYDAHGKEYLDFAAGIAVNALGVFCTQPTGISLPRTARVSEDKQCWNAMPSLL